MSTVFVAGVGHTPFGRLQNETSRRLASAAVREALDDAGLEPGEIGAVYVGNAAAGLLTGQEMIRGQAFLRQTGLLGAPIVNVENACASGSTAFSLAVNAVRSGMSDVALAIGVEMMTMDKARAIHAIETGVVIEDIAALRHSVYGDDDVSCGESLLMDVYGSVARRFLADSGATAEDLATVSVKNRFHASLNPNAQFRSQITVEDVLGSRMVSEPLTLLMCSPIGDGAAALIVCNSQRAARRSGPRVRVASCSLVSGTNEGRPSAVSRAAARAYESAGTGPDDVDVAEVHDAAAPAELSIYEELGFARPGEGAALLRSGDTRLGGAKPVNTSGGLLSKGHPVGATGCSQLVELTVQLRGMAGPRQVEHARIALAENGGGYLGPDPAAACVTILMRE
jgi:acetyl-CoA acyltransferase